MGLNTKSYILIIISAVVITLVLSLLRINQFAVIIIEIIGSLIIYIAWLMIKSTRITKILEEKCDPVLYLEKCTKSHMAHPDYNKAVAYLSLGEYEKALDLLLDGDIPKKMTQIMKVTYRAALMSCYIVMGDLEKAGREYENHIKEMRKGLLVPKVAFSIDLMVLEYQYKLNATPETATYFLEQLRYLYGINSKVLSKRQRLSVLYTEAELLDFVGEKEAAALLYKRVAAEGNTLHIAALAKKKLEALG